MNRIFTAMFVSLLFVRVAYCQTSPAPDAREKAELPIPVNSSGNGQSQAAVVLSNNVVDNPHVVKYRQLPTQWAEGLPLGNGEIGVMCWSDGRRLRFTLDSASAWDLRHKSGKPDYSQLSYRKLREWVSGGDFDAVKDAAKRMGERDRLRPSKLYLGRLEFSCEFESDSELSLCLGDASVRGLLQGKTTSHQLHAFVCRTQDLFCLRLAPWPDGTQLKLRPFYDVSPKLAALGHPEMQVFPADGLTMAIQQVLPDTFFALCWNCDGPNICVSFAKAKDPEKAKKAALAKHPGHGRDLHRELFARHQQSWEKFWSVSGVAIPEKELDFSRQIHICKT